MGTDLQKDGLVLRSAGQQALLLSEKQATFRHLLPCLTA